jgi:hypothetical protein
MTARSRRRTCSIAAWIRGGYVAPVRERGDLGRRRRGGPPDVEAGPCCDVDRVDPGDRVLDRVDRLPGAGQVGDEVRRHPAVAADPPVRAPRVAEAEAPGVPAVGDDRVPADLRVGPGQHAGGRAEPRPVPGGRGHDGPEVVDRRLDRGEIARDGVVGGDPVVGRVAGADDGITGRAHSLHRGADVRALGRPPDRGEEGGLVEVEEALLVAPVLPRLHRRGRVGDAHRGRVLVEDGRHPRRGVARRQHDRGREALGRVQRRDRVVALVGRVRQGAEAVGGEVVGHGRPPFMARPTAARTWSATAARLTSEAPRAQRARTSAPSARFCQASIRSRSRSCPSRRS